MVLIQKCLRNLQNRALQNKGDPISEAHCDCTWGITFSIASVIRLSTEFFLCNCSIWNIMEFFLTFIEFSGFSKLRESDLKHELGQFKDSISHICFAGTVLASWSLTQKKVGSRPFNDKYFYWIQWKHLGKIPLFQCCFSRKCPFLPVASSCEERSGQVGCWRWDIRTKPLPNLRPRILLCCYNGHCSR